VRAITGCEIDIVARPGDRAGDPPPPGAREGDEVLQLTGPPKVGRMGGLGVGLSRLGLCAAAFARRPRHALCSTCSLCSNPGPSLPPLGLPPRQAVLEAARIMLVAVRGNMARGQLVYRHALPPGGG
jgi:hypothetical protein